MPEDLFAAWDDDALSDAVSHLHGLGRHPGWLLLQGDLRAQHAVLCRRLIAAKPEDVAGLQGQVKMLTTFIDDTDSPLQAYLRGEDQASLRLNMAEYMEQCLDERREADAVTAARPSGI